MSIEPAKDDDELANLVATAEGIEAALEEMCLVIRDQLTPMERIYAAEALRYLTRLKGSVKQRWEPILQARQDERDATRERRRELVERRRKRNRRTPPSP